MKRELLPLAGVGLAGCAAIHSFDAARELNPASVVALSGSFGSTWDKRRPPSGGDNTWHNERVLVPDAQVNIRIKLDPNTDLNLDPLPPGVGGGLSFHWRPEEEGVPGVTFSPSISYLVLPPQDVWSAELPLAFSWRAGPRWVIYAGPKYLYQSDTLQPQSGLWGFLFSDIPSRPSQELRLFGGFAGMGFGWTHFQICPEVDYLKSTVDGEEVVQAGVRLRLAL